MKRMSESKAIYAALKLAKGSYQRNIILGIESLSGSTIRGTARDWKGKYFQSRDSLLRRLRTAEVPFAEQGDHLLFGMRAYKQWAINLSTNALTTGVVNEAY
jgi:hypothetical protein